MSDEVNDLDMTPVIEGHSRDECLAVIAECERSQTEFQNYDRAAFEAFRDATRLLARIESHEVPPEFIASAAAHFGDDAGLPTLREYVEMTCPPTLDVNFIIGDLWVEAREQRRYALEEREQATHEPGGWRWLVKYVRTLEPNLGHEGVEALPTPIARPYWQVLEERYPNRAKKSPSPTWNTAPSSPLPAQIGVVPETSHLTTDQANAARLAAHFGGKQLVSAAKDFYVWAGTHWARDPQQAVYYGAQLSRIVRDEAQAWRAKFESMAALNPDGKKLEATARRDMSKLEDNLRATADGLAMVEALYKAEALEKWTKSCEMRTNITNALGLLRDLLTIDADSFDRDPALFNCLNGTIDLRSGKIKPHDPRDLITRCAPINYVLDAQAPRFEKFLTEVLDAERAKFAQSWFGYCLTGEVREHKMLLHIGSGANGKSTLIECIENVMGHYAHTAPRGMLTDARGDDRHPTEIADLFRKRLVTSGESEDNATLRESFVKLVTGGDRLTGRYMSKDFFSFSPTHKLQLLTNHKPSIKGSDHGIWRRLFLLNYQVQFGSEEDIAAGRAMRLRDTTLKDALLAEREGIFAWLVKGAINWYRDGLRPPASVLEASEAYRIEQDRVGQFIHECCSLEPDTWSPFSGAFIGLYPAYGSWCRESGYQPLGLKRFVDELQRIVPKFRKAERKLTINGVRKTVNGAFGVKLNLSEPTDPSISPANVGDLV